MGSLLETHANGVSLLATRLNNVWQFGTALSTFAAARPAGGDRTSRNPPYRSCSYGQTRLA
jgi:hypothetical protein